MNDNEILYDHLLKLYPQYPRRCKLYSLKWTGAPLRLLASQSLIWLYEKTHYIFIMEGEGEDTDVNFVKRWYHDSLLHSFPGEEALVFTFLSSLSSSMAMYWVDLYNFRIRQEYEKWKMNPILYFDE